MKAFILLAGRSQRFWPLSEKSLFPICGTTLLHHQVENLRQSGVRDITFIGGDHNIVRVRALFPDLPCLEQEDLALGMRGALLSALPTAGKEPILIVSGNDAIDVEGFKLLLKKASEKNISGAILASRVPAYFPGGYLTLDGARIRSIVEKPGAGKEPSDLVTIVAHVHNDPAALLHALERGAPGKDDGYERALDLLFKELTYHAVPYEGPWHPVKYPWHLLSLLPYFLQGFTTKKIHPSAEIHPSAVIDGAVHIEEGVRVLPHATIKGPCFIGKRSVIATNALVRGSSIGEDSVIGFSSEVKASVLSHHVWTHMTYIGDSVIGENVSFGGGSVTGNLRLDEGVIQSVVQGESLPTTLTKFGTVIGNDCRLGIQTSIGPGVKIGAGAFVNSCTFVSKDVPEKSFVTMKAGEMDIRPNRSSPPSPESREGFRTQLKPK